jgi:hypothetical protein
LNCTPCAIAWRAAAAQAVLIFGGYCNIPGNDWEQTFQLDGKKVAALAIR